MDDHILDTPYSYAVAAHPGRLAGRKDLTPVKPKQRCLSCGCALTVEPSQGAVLAMHLRQSPECLDSYAKRRDWIGIDGSGLVITQTLHACRNASNRWVVKGVSPSGVLVTVAKCRDRRDALKVLAMFCVDVSDICNAIIQDVTGQDVTRHDMARQHPPRQDLMHS